MFAKKRLPEIPLLTATGGNKPKNSKDILEYRVWVHPKKGGDDYAYVANTYAEILKIRKAKMHEGHVEEPLGVIRDKKDESGYREVVLT